MTPSGIEWFSTLLQQLATAIRKRFQHLDDREGRDLEDLYLNP